MHPTGRQKATSQRCRTDGARSLHHQEEAINVQKPKQITGRFVSAASRNINVLKNHLLSGCCKAFLRAFIPMSHCVPLDYFKGKNLWGWIDWEDLPSDCVLIASGLASRATGSSDLGIQSSAAAPIHPSSSLSIML